MNIYNKLLILFFAFSLISCEEVIDINLNDVDPKIVIEGDINNLSSVQNIRVSRTVPFDAVINSEPIPNASVVVESQNGTRYTFRHTNNGIYQHRNFNPMEKINYTLTVTVDDEAFQATSQMPTYVEVDSLGIVEEKLFDSLYYFINLKFLDPINQPNFYKYNVSVNGGPYSFSTVFSDKFNDGLNVTHQITNSKNDLALGDSLIIRRYSIDASTYKYWSDVQSINPGSAAPANPKSNITNGALGYFSVSSAKELSVKIALQ